MRAQRVPAGITSSGLDESDETDEKYD